MDWFLYVDVPLWVVSGSLIVWTHFLRRRRKLLLSTLQEQQQWSKWLSQDSSTQLMKAGGPLVGSTSMEATANALVQSVFLSGSSASPRLKLMMGENEEFNRTIDLLFRATGWSFLLTCRTFRSAAL